MSQHSLNLYEVTELVNSCDWKNFKNLKDHPMNPKSGLYILIFENKKPVSINDRNVSSEDRRKGELSGKVVIPPSQWVIKFGKFERHFLQRMREYAQHMHYKDSQSKALDPILKDILRFSLMLPMANISNNYIDPAKMFEPFWNASLHSFLDANNYLLAGQNLKSEYRVVRPLRSDDYEKINSLGKDVANKISQMAKFI